MDIYTLDDKLRRENLVDNYVSFIWTERYSGWGDFEVVTHVSESYKKLFAVGTFIAIKQSTRVMMVETSEDTVDDEGESAIKFSGRSLEALLDDRVAFYGMVGSDTGSVWKNTGKPADLARKVFDVVCVQGLLNFGDKLPFYSAGNLYPTGSIAEPADVISVEFEPDSVYNTVKKLCNQWRLGFRICRVRDESKLYFNVYKGSDRTSKQQVRPAVVFSSELDNLNNSTQLQSNAGYKNTAYVFGKLGATIVYADFVNPGVSGFERRVLVVNADNIDGPVGEAYTAALAQRGREELAKHRPLVAFDGETSRNSALEYEKHYFLGDLVEIRRDDGNGSDMLVTEQIFVSDAQGDRAYPTLTLDQVITPGTWFAWSTSEVWADAVPMWADA